MTISGILPTYGSAAAGGDDFSNDGKTFLHIKNGGGASINATVTSQVATPPAGTAAANKVVAVAAGSEQMIGPINATGFNDASGKVQISYSAVASVTVAAISVSD